MSDKNNQASLVASVLGLDLTLQQLLRIHWPEAWLRINLPLGSTRALLAIETQHAHTPGQIADILQVSRTTVTGLIDRLEDAGLLTRAIDPADRRSFVLQLTDAGRALIREIDQFRHEQLQQALQRLDATALQALATGLQALVQQMQPVATPAVETSKKE